LSTLTITREGGFMPDTTTVLAGFGATRSTLTAEQQDQLDRQGYLPLPGAIGPEVLESLRTRFNEIVQTEGDRAGIEVGQETGAARLANLVDKDRLFDHCWNHPLQLAAVAHVLGWHELKLFSLNGRAALPGEGHQGLHADWGEAVRPGSYLVCNSIWLLDAFTEENGATRVVPGSHRSGQRPGDAMADPTGRHPDEVLLLGEAGTCVVFNAHLWHGGTANKTSRPRRALHAAFVRREHRQQTVQRDYLRPETIQKLTSAQRYLLEV
jgi:ectoine hydroxylase-related dioxygenase (phytanoyl-CoA dioxygenase family)